MKAKSKVDALMDRKVDLSKIKPVGSYLDVDEKLVHELAIEYQREEDFDYVSVSWANQVKAQEFYNTHGFVDALDELLRLRRDNVRGETDRT